MSAACAHSHVTLRRITNTSGQVTDEWWCNDCVGGTQFVPIRDLHSARAELEAVLRGGDRAIAERQRGACASAIRIRTKTTEDAALVLLAQNAVRATPLVTEET